MRIFGSDVMDKVPAEMASSRQAISPLDQHRHRARQKKVEASTSKSQAAAEIRHVMNTSAIITSSARDH